MKIFNLLLVALMLGIPFTGNAGRKAKILEGSVAALKDVKKMNLQFSYEGLTIGSEEIPNDEYVKRRKEELNDKEAGKGSTWARAWVNDRASRFEVGFKYGYDHADNGIKIGKFPQEKYTLIFKSTNLEPGYNVGVSRKSALLSGEAWIVETANPSNVICKLLVEDCPGSMGGFDFDNGERIKLSYEVAGLAIAKLIEKEL